MDLVTSRTIPLYTNAGISPSARYIDLLSNQAPRVNKSTIQNYQDSSHFAPIQIGNQSFLALLDTGSADTWIISSDFKCTRSSGCNTLAGYKQTSSFVPTDLKMDVSYSTGERMMGVLGRETVTFCNITAPNATIGIAEKGSWEGDGSSSGTIGLAFPGDTRAYHEYIDDTSTEEVPNIPYTPLFTTMHQQGLVKPYFSIALNRVNEGSGFLALGGLPGPPIRHEEKFTSAKFEYLIFEDGSYGRMGNQVKEYSLYMIKPQGFAVGSQNVTMQVNAVIDTGSPINYLPTDISKSINSLWKPPAKRDQKTWQWVVNCNAVAPDFGFIINGSRLMVSAEDMAIKGGVGILPIVKEKGQCLSTVQDSGIFSFGIHIIGTPFLKSFLTVFDIGAAEMRFARRIR